jgi:hypothetical protein
MNASNAMKALRVAGMLAAAAILSVGSVGFTAAYACGDGSCNPPETTSKGNNGFGQEKHGAVQDGENPGSDKGRGTPNGGPGAGMAGQDSKQNGTGLR